MLFDLATSLAVGPLDLAVRVVVVAKLFCHFVTDGLKTDRQSVVVKRARRDSPEGHKPTSALVSFGEDAQTRATNKAYALPL